MELENAVLNKYQIISNNYPEGKRKSIDIRLVEFCDWWFRKQDPLIKFKHKCRLRVHIEKKFFETLPTVQNGSNIELIGEYFFFHFRESQVVVMRGFD